MMPDDVQVLLNNISTGFRQSLPEAIITTAIFLGFIFGLVYYYTRQQREERSRREAVSEERYAALVRSNDLPTGSSALLDRLATYLKDSSKRYLLLESEASFNSCLKKLSQRESVSPALVAALRLKLGFRALNPERAPLSSGDIAEDSIGILEWKGGEGRVRRSARVAGVEASSMSLEVAEGSRPARGEQVTFYFYNFAGPYTLKSRVLKVEGAVLRLAHSTAIQAVQRRRYYRRKLVAPAYIRSADSETGFIKTLLQDLGGGGARMVNPHNIFEKGDRVELALEPETRAWVRVNAEVVRFGKDGTISVRFENLRETSRDRILRSLFRRYNAFQRELEEDAAANDSREPD